MQMVFEIDGTVRCVNTEEIDLSVIGDRKIKRGSHVEPDDENRWWADMGPVGGPVLGPFEKRGDALTAEVVWLESNWL